MDSRTGIHELGQQEPRFGIVFFAARISHIGLETEHGAVWPLHDIAITNIVWYMAYTGRDGGRAYIARWSCDSIIIGKALQVGGGNKRMIDSHNKAWR